MRSYMFLLFSAACFYPEYISLPKKYLVCINIYIKQIRCHDKEERMLEVESKKDCRVRLCFDEVKLFI